MPSARILITQANLNQLEKLVDLLSVDMPSLEIIQEELENDIMDEVAKSLSANGNTVEPYEIEVHWIVTQRSRNAADYSLELDFSESKEELDPGYKTTASLRKFIRDSVLIILLDTKMLPKKATVAVWVRGQQGGTYLQKNATITENETKSTSRQKVGGISLHIDQSSTLDFAFLFLYQTGQ